MKKILKTASLALTAFLLSAKSGFAQIINPAISKKLGAEVEKAESGATFTTYFIYLWNTAIGLGALIVIGFFIWGSMEWISAGGDSGKLDKARQKLVQSAIGLLILVSSFTIIGFISRLMFGEDFNILKITFPALGET